MIKRHVNQFVGSAYRFPFSFKFVLESIFIEDISWKRVGSFLIIAVVPVVQREVDVDFGAPQGTGG